jgi:hypothetical protein
LQVNPLLELLVEGVGGFELLVYRTTEANVTITNSRGRVQTHRVPFVVTDLKGYLIYLGLPWINACLPKLNYA